MVGTGFQHGQVSEGVEILIMDGGHPADAGFTAFLGNDLLHDLLPCAGVQFGIGGVKVGAGDLEIDGGGGRAIRLVLSVEQALGLPLVGGAQRRLLPGVVVLPVIVPALAGAEHEKFRLHVVTHGTGGYDESVSQR